MQRDIVGYHVRAAGGSGWLGGAVPAAAPTPCSRCAAARRPKMWWRAPSHIAAAQPQAASTEAGTGPSASQRGGQRRRSGGGSGRGRGDERTGGRAGRGPRSRDAAAAAPSRNTSKSSDAIPLSLTDSQLLRWERDGFIVTRDALAPAAVEAVKGEVEAEIDSRMLDALRHRIRVLCPGVDPSRASTPAAARALLRRHATDPLGFLQFFHMHRASTAARAAALGPALAGVAAQLLGVRRVRVLQDAVFMKEPGYDVTNWHSDLRMTPLDTNAFVTAWIPLRPISGDTGDSGLTFAAGSHRDFALPFWHDLSEAGDLGARGYRIEGTGPMRLGDVSWHHGWTLHAAGPQPPRSPPRLALAVSYFADGARVLDPEGDPSVRRDMMHDEDAEGHQEWLRDVKPGGPARHALLPLVWDGGPVAVRAAQR